MKLDLRMTCAALVLAVVALAVAGPLAAQTPGPDVELPRSAQAIVVEYNLIHHMLANPDPQPLMRIYADGLVQIHQPVYMARAGDYELQLSGDEMRALMLGLVADGIMEFDPAAAKEERQLSVEVQRAGGEIHHVSDVTETLIRVSLGTYRPAGAAEAIVNPGRLVRWPNLSIEAAQYPSAASVQSLAQSAERLQAIITRPDLVKVR